MTATLTNDIVAVVVSFLPFRNDNVFADAVEEVNRQRFDHPIEIDWGNNEDNCRVRLTGMDVGCEAIIGLMRDAGFVITDSHTVASKSETRRLKQRRRKSPSHRNLRHAA